MTPQQRMRELLDREKELTGQLATVGEQIRDLMAEALGVRIGSRVTHRDKEYEVVAILRRYGSLRIKAKPVKKDGTLGVVAHELYDQWELKKAQDVSPQSQTNGQEE